MRKAIFAGILITFALFCMTSCHKDSVEPKLIFKFKFDSTQTRLNNFGNPATMPSGHAGQSPVFNKMSAHYIELAPGALTALGSGAVLYRADETSTGGSNAIDFDKSAMAANGETFYSMPLKNVTAGTYEYLRVSLAYQSYDIKFLLDTSISYLGTNYPVHSLYDCRVASFIGFNSYIKNVTLKDKTVSVNGNRTQGYWAAESWGTIYGYTFDDLQTGQAPGTTVVNPISSTSPIPAGSCVVTAAFNPGKLTITGNETRDMVIEVSLSTNKSFEWNEVVNDGNWEPAKGENVVDMGVRGMVPTIK